MVTARDRASLTSMAAVSPMIFQTRSPRCWQWTKKRLAPEGSTRRPNPLSLPSRMSYAVLRGLSARTRASVRSVLGISPLPVSVASWEPGVDGSVRMQQCGGEKTTLCQIVSTVRCVVRCVGACSSSPTVARNAG